MAKQRERNRIRSSMDTLPEDIRAKVDGWLANLDYTYQGIVEELKELGYEVSRSAIGRYAMRHNSAARRLREASEQTRALVSIIRENQDMEATELASSILVDALTRRFATAEEEFDMLPIDKAGRLLVQLQRSTVYKERFRKDRRTAIESVERNILARMRQLIQNNPQLLGDLEAIVHEAAQEEALRDEG